MRIGTAALPWPGMAPWPTNRAPSRNKLWLIPPMATHVVPNQPTVRGWVRGGGDSPKSGEAGVIMRLEVFESDICRLS